MSETVAPVLIAGELRAADAVETFEAVNPATGETLSGSYPVSAWSDVDAALDSAGLAARMLLQVHDELIFEVPEPEVDATVAVVTDIMENAAMPAVSMKVPLKVDARAADNWDEAH